MSIIPYQNGSSSIDKGSIIFAEGQNTLSLNIPIQGKIDVFISPFDKCDGMDEHELLKKSFRIFSTGQNVFLGANDLFLSKKYSFTYCASENSMLHMLMVQNNGQLKTLMESQRDYSAYIITSVSSLLMSSYSSLSRIDSLSRSVNVLADNLVVYLWWLKEQLEFPNSPSKNFFREGLDNLQKLKDNNIAIPQECDNKFFETDYSSVFGADYGSGNSLNLQKIEYYKRLFDNVPMDIRKSFFGSDSIVSSYNCKDVSGCLEDLQTALKSTLSLMLERISRLYSENDECLLSEYAKAAIETKNNGADSAKVLKLLEYIIEKIENLSSLLKQEYSYSLEVSQNYLKNIRSKARKSDTADLEFSEDSLSSVQSSEGSENLPAELCDSAQKILDFSGVSYELADSFMSTLGAFRRLKDRLSSDTRARSIRSSLASGFFEIYEAVFKRVYSEKNTSRLFHMFLMFGFMDELLLSPDRVLKLYRMADSMSSGPQSTVFNMRDWLSRIYSMDKDPSINEFGQDYFEVFREMKKRGDISDKEKVQYDNDTGRRLSHEIHNMLSVNQRVCHSQISTYVPILHDDMIIGDISRALITPQRISDSISRLLQVDFSLFHREIYFRHPEKEIEKELVMKAFFPEIVLIPIFGSRAVMWQEITGRSRSTPARFLIPVLTSENVDDMILRLGGNFRWELCRTMMGPAWNDITSKSLTSEYTDYIQFYRKNTDLSEEAKVKVKSQIQKYHNKLRDIFTSDYEAWINYESKGIMRLNKVARKILYRNCPFSKGIRENLGRQAAYTDSAVQFANFRSKHAKVLESHYNKYIKAGISLEPELEENLAFYKNM